MTLKSRRNPCKSVYVIGCICDNMHMHEPISLKYLVQHLLVSTMFLAALATQITYLYYTSQGVEQRGIPDPRCVAPLALA